MNQRIGITAIGDTNTPATFSGIPYHFLEAAQHKGWNAEGWKMDLNRLNRSRKLWNLLQILSLNRTGGFQYSKKFSTQLLKQIDPEFLSRDIISFNQHVPPANEIIKHNGRIFHYIDATFSQLIDRYEIGKIIGKKIKNETLAREKDFFQAATHIVTFQQWAKNSVIQEYGIDESKVSVVLPGANVIYRKAPQFNPLPQEIGKQTPLVLGFIGKDWKRKGLDILIEAAEILKRNNYKVVIHCIGNAPKDFISHPLVRFSGFIDKSTNVDDFISFIQTCHIGCLFSKAEFSSISVFEFLRFGIPVAGYVVDGMGDLYFNDCSIRFKPSQTSKEIAEQFIEYIENIDFRTKLKNAAEKRSNYVTWDRSIIDWNKILL